MSVCLSVCLCLKSWEKGLKYSYPFLIVPVIGLFIAEINISITVLWTGKISIMKGNSYFPFPPLCYKILPASLCGG